MRDGYRARGPCLLQVSRLPLCALSPFSLHLCSTAMIIQLFSHLASMCTSRTPSAVLARDGGQGRGGPVLGLPGSGLAPSRTGCLGHRVWGGHNFVCRRLMGLWWVPLAPSQALTRARLPSPSSMGGGVASHLWDGAGGLCALCLGGETEPFKHIPLVPLRGPHGQLWMWLLRQEVRILAPLTPRCLDDDPSGSALTALA